MVTQYDFEEQLASVAMGDRAAFRALYDETAPRLFGICLRILSDRLEAEDALSDVYLRIWNTPELYRDIDDAPMIWMIALTRDTAVVRRRALTATAAHARQGAVQAAGQGPDPLTSHRPRGDDPGSRFTECLRGLHSDSATMIRRAYLDGHTYRDLAKATGVDPLTTRIWLRRSLAQLRECLSQ